MIPSIAAKTKYCSHECSRMALQTGSFTYCEGCGEAFYTTVSRNKKYCSNECCSKAKTTAVTVNCSMCKKETLKNLCHLEGREHTFCSYSCAYKFRKVNKKYNSQFRKKISKGKIKYYKENPEARLEQSKRIIEGFKSGRYPKTRTKPHVAVCKILKRLNVDFIEEYPMGNYVVDIYLPYQNTAIEIQGTYWHADTRFYNRNNINATQQYNVDRDKLKKDFITGKRKTNLVELWEHDIKNNISTVKGALKALSKRSSGL